MTRNQIVEQLFVGKNFNDCLRKMEPEHLQEDLKMEVISIVCEWPDEKVIKLYEEKSLEFYVVRVILNQVKSKTSPFAKLYRTPIVPITKEVLNVEEDLEARAIKEMVEDLTIEEINRLYWYDAEMIRLYLKLGSFRAIEEDTGIPFISCYKNIKKSLNTLKRKAEDMKAKGVFTKEERSFIQNSNHARIPGNTI